MEPFIRITTISNSNEMQIMVEDNGEGIDEKYQPFIFDMYFRGSERSRGNGLGLYIIKKVVDRLKGTIVINSSLNQGTSVIVCIPHQLSLHEFLRLNTS